MNNSIKKSNYKDKNIIWKNEGQIIKKYNAITKIDKKTKKIKKETKKNKKRKVIKNLNFIFYALMEQNLE